MSEIKVNSIKGVAASSAAITINNTDGTATANLTNRTNKNLIINGAMRVAQRGTSSTTFGYHTVDRFQTDGGGFDEIPTQAQVDVSSSDTPYTLGLTKAWKITNGNQTNGAGAGDYIRLNHKIEAQDIRNSGWNYKSSSSNITLSFWVKSSVAQTFYLIVKAEDSPIYLYATPYSATTSWTKITKTISGNSNLVFDNDNQVGLTLFFPLFYGTDYTDNSASDDTWGAYNGSSQTKDQTSTWYTTNDSTFEITGIQLEVGSVATDFEHRSFAVEERLCQRYYFRQNAESQYARYACHGQCPSANGVQFVYQLPVKMRAGPTIGYSALSDFNLYASNLQNKVPTNIAMNQSSTVSPMFNGDKSGTFSVGTMAHLTTAGSATGYLEFIAEL